VLNAHRSDANLCQRLMIELACVVLSHAGRESISLHAVKQNIELLRNGLLYRISALPDQTFDRLERSSKLNSWSPSESKKASNFFKDMLSLRRGRPTPKSPPALPSALAGRVEPFARDRPRGILNAKLPSATRWSPFEGSCGARRMYQCPSLSRMAWKFQPPSARDSRKRSATRHKIGKAEVRPSDHRD
jgi:hypothetical protein